MQDALPEPFLRVSPDHLVASGMLPARAIRTARSPDGSRCGRGSSMASAGACPHWRQPETTSSPSTSSSSAPGASTWPRCPTPGCLPRRRAPRSGRDRPPRTRPGRSPHRRGPAARGNRPDPHVRALRLRGRHDERSPQRGCRICTGRLASRDPSESFAAGHIWQPGTITRTCRYRHSSQQKRMFSASRSVKPYRSSRAWLVSRRWCRRG
jgi:hypothetical protein